MNRLIVPETLAVKAKVYLFQDDGEHFIFFLCSVIEGKDGMAFSADEIIIVDDKNLVMSGFSLEIQLPELIRVMNMANDAGKVLVEAHNHPRGFSSFSYTDLRGYSEFVPYVLDTLRRPYGATVWDGDAVIGLCWKKDASKPEEMMVFLSPHTSKQPRARRPRK
jgi:hypothetical protein